MDRVRATEHRAGIKKWPFQASVAYAHVKLQMHECSNLQRSQMIAAAGTRTLTACAGVCGGLLDSCTEKARFRSDRGPSLCLCTCGVACYVL